MSRNHCLYKSVWYWNEEERKLSTYGFIDKEKPKPMGAQLGSSTKLLDDTYQRTQTISTKVHGFYFTENIDQNQQMIFRQKYQRGVKPHLPNIVTLQDVKDVVMFLAHGYIPTRFIELFCSPEINLLLRCVILYIQLYLKVWEDLEYRSSAYNNQRLKHPISVEREILCKTNLSMLRSRIGQEYALIISGERNYKKYHHMNNTLNRSYTDQDVMLFDYFSTFTTKAVWIALNRTNYKEIETEVIRLFQLKDVKRGEIRFKDCVNSDHEAEVHILQGNSIQYLSKWHKLSPIISDIFINKYIPDTVEETKLSKIKLERTILTGLEAALKLPEELLTKFGITVGILGLPRDGFEPLLTIRQRQKSLQDEELEKIKLAETFVEVKPQIAMYEYLSQLETVVNLKSLDSSEETSDILQEINTFEKYHLEEAKRSFRFWRLKKGQSFMFY